MKILLTTLNSKYVHSGLALRYLYQVSRDSGLDIALQEFTINNEYEYILGELIKGEYDLVCFSCYIWNIEYIKRLGEDLKKACPGTGILLGGPEVSYEATEFMNTHKWVDMINRGEGEMTFYQLCKVFVRGTDDFSTVGGLTYREGGEILSTVDNPLIPMDELPFPYKDLELEYDKVIYYEASRGCPFRCSYCMSSIDKRIRALSLDKVYVQLQFFIDRRVKQVKFIDRTFNYDKKRAYEIWKYLIENDNGITNFHFEICADLLDDEDIVLLKTARKGLFQFEIGVQTANPITLKAINRNSDIHCAFSMIKKLISMGNCHIHVDLIAGLPYEGYRSFSLSFNKLYALKADELQLGFLKVLKGTPLYEKRDEYGYFYSSIAPYQVISGDFISSKELVMLKDIERVLDLYYNRGGFRKTLEVWIEATGEPFSFFEVFAKYYCEEGHHHRYHKKEDLYRILDAFSWYMAANGHVGESFIDKTRECLTEDMIDTLNEDAVKRFFKKGWKLNDK